MTLQKMRQVFIDGKLLKIDNSYDSSFQYCFPYQGKKTLVKALGILKKDSSSQVLVYGKPISTIWKTFKDLYLVVRAAGGVVRDPKKGFLFIYRNKKWDLPKGKMEEKETKKGAAIREVEEECGIKWLTITRKFPTTYHVYTDKNDRILKKTFWYEMNTEFNDSFTPQKKEGITKVKWKKGKKLKRAMKNSYPNIKFMLEPYILTESGTNKV